MLGKLGLQSISQIFPDAIAEFISTLPEFIQSEEVQDSLLELLLDIQETNGDFNDDGSIDGNDVNALINEITQTYVTWYSSTVVGITLPEIFPDTIAEFLQSEEVQELLLELATDIKGTGGDFTNDGSIDGNDVNALINEITQTYVTWYSSTLFPAINEFNHYTEEFTDISAVIYPDDSLSSRTVSISSSSYASDVHYIYKESVFVESVIPYSYVSTTQAGKTTVTPVISDIYETSVIALGETGEVASQSQLDKGLVLPGDLIAVFPVNP